MGSDSIDSSVNSLIKTRLPRLVLIVAKVSVVKEKGASAPFFTKMLPSLKRYTCDFNRTAIFSNNFYFSGIAKQSS